MNSFELLRFTVDMLSGTLRGCGRLLMFEISYNLQMREQVECGGSPWLRMRGVIYNLNGVGDKYY